MRTTVALPLRCARALVDCVYPPACLLCGTSLPNSSSPLCPACDTAMPRLLAPVCSRCGLGLAGAYDAQLTCASCQRHPPAFDQARAPFVYARAVPDVIKAFKYHGRHRLGSWLAAQMVDAARRHLPLEQVRAVVPVPLHWLKRRLRSLDPPAVLAWAMAKALRLPCVALLRRIRWTATQTQLTPTARVRNVDGAFRLRAGVRLDGGVLLIDDVLTSGATANACANVLHAAGIAPVYVMAAAKTPHQ